MTILLLWQGVMYGNNIQVSNVTLTGQNTVDDYTLVEFDISWENSWRVVGGPGNWDAAWVFVKYRIGAGPWLHAWINNSGHTAPSGSTIEVGLLDPGAAFNNMTNPGMGIFIYRSSPGSGTFALTDVKLRWNYGDNGLSDNEQVDIKVFAIEHVYVPQGAFYVGSGGGESGSFYIYDPGPDTDPYLINSEGAINVGMTTGYLYYQNTSTYSGDQMGPIPATFPKGYAAFYMMKYEVSQKGYVDFLNTLTRTQQISRVRSDISTPYANENFVLENNYFISYRNGVACRVDIPAQPAEVQFFCNLNSNVAENEAADGLNIACNFLSWADQAAYLDWAGLRVMTELEFEKSGRGTAAPSPGEYAWGNSISYLTTLAGLQNGGFPDETFTVLANGPNLNAGGIGFQSPMRCGALAGQSSDRTKAGASYYGVMELSGNLWERGVSAGISNGRIYTGKHGDGIITATGNANVINWPDAVTGDGLSFRGGAWSTDIDRCLLSDRFLAANSDPSSYYHTGCRGVRTAPQ